MNNWIRLGISVVAGVILSAGAYMLPFDIMLFCLAPGFWLSNTLPDSLVNAVGAGLFIVLASALVWALVIFGVWLLLARLRTRNR
jgi:hypothetical protein